MNRKREYIMATITMPPPEDNLGSSPQFPERYVYLMVYRLMCSDLRPSEILDVNSQSIDLEKRIVTITSRKSRRTRKVYIPPRLRQILLAFREPNHARLAAMKRVARLLRLRRKK